MKLTLSALIKRAYRTNGYVSAGVIGEMGIGKTSYALHVASEIYGWDKALQYLFFKPQDAVRVMRKALDSGKRIPLLIMDDAGFWLSKLTWWEEHKVVFMDFYNLIRTVCASIIFTCPGDELPKVMRKKMYFRITISPLHKNRVIQLLEKIPKRELEVLRSEGRDIRYWNIAKGYKLQTLPSYMQYVRSLFEDIYPLHYPKHIYLKYEEMRRVFVREALEKAVKRLCPSVLPLFNDWMKILKRGKTEEIDAKEFISEYLVYAIPMEKELVGKQEYNERDLSDIIKAGIEAIIRHPISYSPVKEIEDIKRFLDSLLSLNLSEEARKIIRKTVRKELRDIREEARRLRELVRVLDSFIKRI